MSSRDPKEVNILQAMVTAGQNLCNKVAALMVDDIRIKEGEAAFKPGETFVITRIAKGHRYGLRVILLRQPVLPKMNMTYLVIEAAGECMYLDRSKHVTTDILAASDLLNDLTASMKQLIHHGRSTDFVNGVSAKSEVEDTISETVPAPVTSDHLTPITSLLKLADWVQLWGVHDPAITWEFCLKKYVPEFVQVAVDTDQLLGIKVVNRNRYNVFLRDGNSFQIIRNGRETMRIESECAYINKLARNHTLTALKHLADLPDFLRRIHQHVPA